MHQLSNQLSLAATLEEIGSVTRRSIMAKVNADALFILLLTPQDDSLDYFYGFKNGQEIDLSLNPPPSSNEEFIATITQTNELLHITDRANWSQKQGQSTTVNANLTVWLGLPILLFDELMGVLILESDAPFSEHQIELLTTVVKSMAVAIHSLLKSEAVTAALNIQFEQRVQLQAAADIAAAATTILDQSQLSHEIVELIRSRFNYGFVGLYLVAEDGETAVLHAGTGNIGQELVAQGHSISLNGESIIALAIDNGQAQVLQDIHSAKPAQPNQFLPDTHASLTIPMYAHGLIIGAIHFASAETDIFGQETISVLQALSDQLASAIVNTRLFAHAQESLEETNRLYEASRQINTANTSANVYQALVDFAQDSKLFDAAYIIAIAPDDPSLFWLPALWNRTPGRDNQQNRFPREKFHFGEQLSYHKLALIRNSQTDSKLGRLARHLARQNNLRALALIPIQKGGEWLATLALQRIKANPIIKMELQPFFTLVDQAAVILSNQRLLNQAETLSRVGKELSQALTPTDALDTAVHWVANFTGAPQCRFILYNKQTGLGTIAAEHMPTALAKTVRFPMVDDFVFDYLSQKKNSLLLNKHNDASLQCLHRYVHPFGAKSSLLVPATSQQELIGFLAIDSQQEERPFTQANIIFAQTIVDQLTIQLENLTLLEETLNRAQELITLNQIQSDISGVLDLSGLAQTVYKQVGRLLDNTIFILARYHADTKIYDPILHINNDKTVQAASRKIDTNEPLHQLLFGLRPIITNHKHPIMTPPLISGLEEIPQSSLWMPLTQDSQPTGFISLQSYQPRSYTETDIQLLRSIATYTNLAIANARLFEEIQASNEQLRQLDNLKTQFLTNMTHELRTPLNSIIGFSRVMLKGIDGPLTEAQEEDLTLIYSNGQHLLSLINEILDMAKIEAGKMSISFEPVDLVQATQTALNITRSLINEEEVRLVADIDANIPQIDADPVRIRQILNNLLSNAAKFTMRGSIRLLVERQGDQVHIAIEDTGVGIQEKDFASVFKPFEQIENKELPTIGGTGLGLPITSWLINMHNGRIHLDSQPGEGSAFHVYLPIKQLTDIPVTIPLSEPPLVQ